MLRVDGLVKDFASVRALDDVSFQVAPGEVVGFLGPNGAGKTTTMRAIMGLITLDAGSVTWAGVPIGDVARQQAGYLPAERGLYPRMRVVDHLAYYARLSGLGSTESEAAVTDWIERLELDDYADAQVQTLSSGNQQRVQLGLALISHPDLLLLDEPFAGLDPVAAATLRRVLTSEAERGVSVLLSSHQLDLVADVCSSVVVVKAGRVVLDGRVNELRAADSRRVLEITFIDPTDWRPASGTAHRLNDTTYRIDLPVSEAEHSILADARTAGLVASYSYRPPSLSEIFLESVRDGSRS